jgi:hypothetical protein
LRRSRPVADVRPPRLEGLEVRAGRNLAVKLLAGKPDFQVEGLGRGEAGVARAEQNAAIGQAQRLQNLFRVARQPLVLGVGVLGPGELDQLDFLKLMLADDAARILARRSSLGAEAGRV